MCIRDSGCGGLRMALEVRCGAPEGSRSSQQLATTCNLSQRAAESARSARTHRATMWDPPPQKS
eukprot:10524422-Alexandrium_andersonii.AAC.1